jgi:Cu/Ag efflux pump CusA
MIDFVLERLRHEHKSAEEAICEAAVLRFRPIMMTTMAAILGTMPIALGIGAGTDLRQPLGVAVVGGLVVSQALILCTIPVTYIYMEEFGEWLERMISGRSRAKPRGIPKDHSLVPAGHYPPPARSAAE